MDENVSRMAIITWNHKYRPGTAFWLKKYRNYRRIIAKTQETFLQNKGHFRGDVNEFEW